MTAAREWLDVDADVPPTMGRAIRMRAALRAVLDPETVEAMADAIRALPCIFTDTGIPDDIARAAHAAVVARIDAALGTVTP